MDDDDRGLGGLTFTQPAPPPTPADKLGRVLGGLAMVMIVALLMSAAGWLIVRIWVSIAGMV